MEPDLDRFTSRRSTVYGTGGLVTTSQPLAAQAGLSVMREGGNAFDAAVATAAALNVVEPTMTGLGGDVFALYRTADGDVGAMRSCGGAPREATLERVRDTVASERGVDPAEARMPFRGPHTVTVPGTARGWEATIDRLGTQSLADVLAPAIQYATEGYPVTEVIADQWRDWEHRFTRENARRAYLKDGLAPRTGEPMVLSELGESLRTVAEEGADAIYEGSLGEQIVAEVRDAGGFLSMEDLAAHTVEWPDPVSTTYRGAEVFELPPNNQGLIALEALNIAAEVGAGDHPYDSPERVHALAEAMKLAFHDGHRYISDPEFVEVPPLASREWARDRAQRIGDRALTDVSIGLPRAPAEDADTVLLATADADGNVVSYINSRYDGFGSGLVAGDTGIALQNRGASFSLDPEHPNRLQPGKRPFHTLIPAVANLAPGDWAAFGVMGGYMQPQGHLQVVSNLVDYDMPLQRALDEPRFRYRESGALGIEGTFGGNLQSKLARKGHEVRIFPPSEFGGAQIARRDGDVLSGATEPRKDGAAVAF